MKVSTARNVSVEKVVEEQEVNAVILPRKDPVIRKSPGNRANNSRTPMGKVIKAGGKEDAVRMRQCYVKISKGMLIASLFHCLSFYAKALHGCRSRAQLRCCW